jgi:hypothetical protein
LLEQKKLLISKVTGSYKGCRKEVEEKAVKPNVSRRKAVSDFTLSIPHNSVPHPLPGPVFKVS